MVACCSCPAFCRLSWIWVYSSLLQSPQGPGTLVGITCPWKDMGMVAEMGWAQTGQLRTATHKAMQWSRPAWKVYLLLFQEVLPSSGASGPCHFQRPFHPLQVHHAAVFTIHLECPPWSLSQNHLSERGRWTSHHSQDEPEPWDQGNSWSPKTCFTSLEHRKFRNPAPAVGVIHTAAGRLSKAALGARV